MVRIKCFVASAVLFVRDFIAQTTRRPWSDAAPSSAACRASRKAVCGHDRARCARCAGLRYLIPVRRLAASPNCWPRRACRSARLGRRPRLPPPAQASGTPSPNRFQGAAHDRCIWPRLPRTCRCRWPSRGVLRDDGAAPVKGRRPRRRPCNEIDPTGGLGCAWARLMAPQSPGPGEELLFVVRIAWRVGLARRRIMSSAMARPLHRRMAIPVQSPRTRSPPRSMRYFDVTGDRAAYDLDTEAGTVVADRFSAVRRAGTRQPLFVRDRERYRRTRTTSPGWTATGSCASTASTWIGWKNRVTAPGRQGRADPVHRPGSTFPSAAGAMACTLHRHHGQERLRVHFPFYWNIAPNLDYTIRAARVCPRRGVLINNEFRTRRPSSPAICARSSCP